MKKLGFVGAGKMAQALAGGIVSQNPDVEVVVYDPVEQAIENFTRRLSPASVKPMASNREVFEFSDAVFLAVKPQSFQSAIESAEIEKALSSRANMPVVVSVMAGVTIDLIEKQTGVNQIARVMPNTPCLVGAGAMAVAFSDAVDEASREAVRQFLQTTGLVKDVSEEKLDAVTGLSGSGPAYVFEFTNALAAGGVRAGLTEEMAMELAVQTVLGAAKLIVESGEHPLTLKDRVTSPGGTTLEGLKALSEAGFEAGVIAAVESATRRSKELGKTE